MIAFLLVAVASIAFNVERITNLGEWNDAQKHLAVLFSLGASSRSSRSTCARPSCAPFSVLIVVLAVITAAGTIYEKKTGYNVFYETSAAVFSPIADVDHSPTEINPNPSDDAATDDHRADPARALGDLDPRHGAALRRRPGGDHPDCGGGACSGASPPA